MKKLASALLIISMLAMAVICLFPASAVDAPATYTGWIEGMGTPIFSNYADVNTGAPIDYILVNDKGISTSGGSQDYRVINDGAIAEHIFVGGKAVFTCTQFDSYLPAFKNVARTEYIGYTFAQTFKVTEVVFHQGRIEGEKSGYFSSLAVEARIGGEWKVVESNVAEVYKQNAARADFSNYQIFNIQLKEATACDGIRLTGSVGNYISCVEIQVKAVDIAIADADIEKIAKPVINYFPNNKYTKVNGGGSVGSNSGGSFNFNTIRDGVTDKTVKAYDNYYDGSMKDKMTLGYEFIDKVKVEKIVFQNGGVSANGGYFSADVVVEALIGNEWKVVESDIDTAYPETVESFATYTITLKNAVECNGIRLNGTAGGAKPYIACNEFDVVLAKEAATTEKPADTTTKPADTTTKPADTTTQAAETTTKAAETTTKVAETTKATTTAAATTAAEKGGCGSMLSIGALAVCAVVGGAVLLKKKED